MSHFDRYIGIDYSGAQTPTASLKGLRVYVAEGGGAPVEIAPAPSPRKYWTRRGVAEWLAARLAEDVRSLVGIDHGFSFPEAYFERHQLPRDWPAFLEDFVAHWPTAEDQVSVELVRDGLVGNGAARGGETRWRRQCDLRARAKSVFHFDVQGQVAKSTHAGLPWLKYLRDQFGARVHFWPFDGWKPPGGISVVAEAYPAVWNKSFAREGRNDDQHDAWTIATALSQADRAGDLGAMFKPELSTLDRETAEFEGWILGVC